MQSGVEELNSNDLRYLKMLSYQYPTIQAASTEIINLQVVMGLPKGTEHFISDVHGEHEAFLHILNSCSGVVREKLDELFGSCIPRADLDQLATLIYYPREKLEYLQMQIEDIDEWYRITLHRLTESEPLGICKALPFQGSQRTSSGICGYHRGAAPYLHRNKRETKQL